MCYRGRAGKPISDAEIEAIRNAHRSGMSISEISRRLRCARNTVRKYVRTSPTVIASRYREIADKLDSIDIDWRV